VAHARVWRRRPCLTDTLTKRLGLFFLIDRKEYFALKKCESRFVTIALRHGRQIEFLDRAVGNNPRYSQRYPPRPPGS
jgi:hypothetical protein